MAENEYGKSGHLFFFHFLEAYNFMFWSAFFRASFLHIFKDADGM